MTVRTRVTTLFFVTVLIVMVAPCTSYNETISITEVDPAYAVFVTPTQDTTLRGNGTLLLNFTVTCWGYDIGCNRSAYCGLFCTRRPQIVDMEYWELYIDDELVHHQSGVLLENNTLQLTYGSNDKYNITGGVHQIGVLIHQDIEYNTDADQGTGSWIAINDYETMQIVSVHVDAGYYDRIESVTHSFVLVFTVLVSASMVPIAIFYIIGTAREAGFRLQCSRLDERERKLLGCDDRYLSPDE